MYCQKKMFSLDTDITYLNGAYMSPLLKSAEQAGIAGLQKKRTPSLITKEEFFDSTDEVRGLFTELINGEEANRSVIIPSASYALANVARNIHLKPNSNIILIGEQFPSNYYIWHELAKKTSSNIKILTKPDPGTISWTQKIIDNIDENTSVVTMAHVHWGDGSLFDLERISQQVKSVGSYFIIDGTQSIGVLTFDQKKIQADAIVASSYKWLLGPYASGLAYFGDAFLNGSPMEESWLNRVKSDDFQYLTNYQSQYRKGSRRYEVGEAPDFIKMPMLKESLSQLIEWGANGIQQYCKSIVEPIIQPLREQGFGFNSIDEMAFHIFGIYLPQGAKMSKIKTELAKQKISVSYRQNVIRVSPNVYNSSHELVKLKNALLNTIK